MKTTLWVCAALLGISSCDSPPKKQIEKQTMAIEKKNGPATEWISLFDGKSMKGWHQYNGEGVGEEWSVSDGIMTFQPKANRQWGDGGKNIVTDQEFTNFELSLEWNVSEGGNSGIFWGVKESEEYGEPYATGPEIQILDNERHPDANANPKFHQAGALYDLVQPSADVCNPAGEWNHVLLTVNHNTNKGSVVFNGTEIVRFPLSGPEWEALVKNSKFKDWEGFGAFKTGKIGLQDHDDKVSFRNIKIREIQ
ncbi:MAG: 3-keto-disaccharide hydrolase [Flavobacteriaceae bacterium]